MAAPDQPKSELQKVQKAIETHRNAKEALGAKAATLEREIERIRTQTVALAARITSFEAAVYASTARTRHLNAALRQAKTRLAARHDELEEVLGAILRLSGIPRGALLASPEDAAKTYRAALVLRALVPELRVHAQELGGEIAKFSALKAAAAQEQGKLVAERDRLAKSRAALRQLLAAKAADEQETLAARRQENRNLQSLAVQATSLKALIEKITEEEQRRARARAKAEAAKAAEARKQRLAALSPSLPSSPSPPAGAWIRRPAEGRLIEGYGMKNALGVTAQGITIATVPDALVVAPRSGEVMFAGPFRGYGLLLIIKQAEGYHLLMAGFARIDANVGQRLMPGEPVGQMGTANDGKARLYVEIRYHESSVDPMPWLTIGKGKVSG